MASLLPVHVSDQVWIHDRQQVLVSPHPTNAQVDPTWHPRYSKFVDEINLGSTLPSQSVTQIKVVHVYRLLMLSTTPVQSYHKVIFSGNYIKTPKSFHELKKQNKT